VCSIRLTVNNPELQYFISKQGNQYIQRCGDVLQEDQGLRTIATGHDGQADALASLYKLDLDFS
jgi:hypothetical protein